MFLADMSSLSSSAESDVVFKSEPAVDPVVSSLSAKAIMAPLLARLLSAHILSLSGVLRREV